MSKIVDVLDQIVKGNEGIKIFSYRDKFATLWNLDEKSSTIVIVWDDIPPRQQDVVATNKYLTPIDWAVAFSLAVHDAALKDDPKSPSYKDLRILILDLNSQSVSNADSVRLVKQSPYRSLMSMPWVRLYRPAVSNNPENKKPEWDAVDLINNIKGIGDNNVPSLKESVEKEKPDMDLIRNIWAAFLTKPSTPGDHHAIANLVGPLLLMGKPPVDVNEQDQRVDGKKQDSHVEALRNLMKALGLIPNKAKEEKSKAPGTEQQEDPLLREGPPWIKWDAPEWKQRLDKVLNKDGGKLNLILIDDQYQQGWGEVLCQAVGATQKSKICGIGSHITASGKEILVKASVSPDCLLSSLDGKDQRFNFNICSDPAKDAEILFLDLRLFAGKRSEEVKFFESLCDIAAKFVDNNDSKEERWKGVEKVKDLPWTGFSSTEIERVRTWSESDNKNKQGEDSAYIEALTFLPRILSLTDLSLPIVIFSSTGRRDIAEKLKGYGNIITDFDKPKFTVDMPDDIAEQTKRKFQEAFAKAMGCLAIRKHLNDLFKECKTVSIPNRSVSENDLFAALYIDESGDGSADSPLVLGGIMAVGNNRDQLKGFEDDLCKKPPNWTKGGGLPKMCKDMKEYSDYGKTIMDRAKKSGVKLYGIVLCQSSCDGVIPPDMLLDDSVLDNLHRNMLRTLIEVVVSYVVPNIAGENVLHLSVFADVRSLPVEEMKQQDPDIVDQLLDRFGMRAKDFSIGGRLLESGNLVKKYESTLPAIYELEMPQTSTALQEPTLSDAADLQLPQTAAPTFKHSTISNLITGLTTSNPACRPKGQYFYVLDEKDVYPIVSSVLEEYRYSNIKIEIEAAKALMVPEPQTQSWSNVSQLIYFADWFPRMVYYSHSRKDKQWLAIEWIQHLTSQGCIGTCDSSLEGLLRTRRLLMEGAESAAVSSLLGITIEKRSTIFPNTLNQLLLADLSTMMRTLPGEAFIDSFEEIGKTELANSQTRGKLFVVQQIDLLGGTVILKDSATGGICTVNIRCWEKQALLPPLIGDTVSECVKHGRGGSKVNGINAIEGVNTWRFDCSGLKGKVESITTKGIFIIKGDKRLGKGTIIKFKPTDNIQLAIGDEVIFTLLRGFSPFPKSPWSLVATDVVKAQSTPTI